MNFSKIFGSDVRWALGVHLWPIGPPDVRKLDSSFRRRLPGDRDLDVGLPARATGDFAVGTFDL